MSNLVKPEIPARGGWLRSFRKRKPCGRNIDLISAAGPRRGHRKTFRAADDVPLVTRCARIVHIVLVRFMLRLQSWRNVERRPIWMVGDIRRMDSSQIHHTFIMCHHILTNSFRHHFVSRSPEGRPEVCLDALNLNSADQLRQLPGDTMVL